MKQSVFVVLVMLVLVPLLLSSCQMVDLTALVVTGSGNVETRQFDVADFNSVETGSAFHVTINQGDSFGVTVRADENFMDYVRVEKIGSTLKIDLDNNAGRVRGLRLGTLEAEITMPRLEELRLSGASHGEIAGFDSDHDVAIDLSGASWLKGQISSRSIRFNVSGASHINKLQGRAESITVDGGGASQVELPDYSVQNARVRLSGASSARLNVQASLDYDLSGASHLEYDGRPVIGRTETSGGASAHSR